MPIIGGRGAGVRGLGFQGAGKPNQVTGLTATDFGTSRSYNNGRIDLSWSTPANNGAPITGYRIERSTNGSSYSAISVNTGTTATTYSDTGLNSNQIYYYKVAAINAVDTGDLSTAANATATTVPQAPTIGTATGGNASATVAYTAGATGGKTVTTYTATSSPGSLTGTGSSPITVSGLSNGTAYTFTVTATNANGTSSASSASNSVTPVTPVPGTSFTVGTLPVSAGSSYKMVGAGPYIFLSGNSATYYTTTNGSSWTSRTFPVASGFKSISFYNNIYVAVGDSYTSSNNSTKTYYTSTDLINWTSRTINDNDGWARYVNYITTDGSRHVMIFRDDSNTRHTFFTSTDGINWSQYVSVAVNSYSSIYRISGNPYYINGNWVISFVDNSQFIPQGIAYSSNLTSWTRYTQSPSNAYLYPSEVSIKSDYSIGITSGNGGSSGQYRYFTAPNSYTYSSALGTGWSNTPPIQPHQSNVFLVKNGDNTWYRSTNATSWTSHSLTGIGNYLVSGGWASSTTSGIITGWSWSYSQTGYIYSNG